jgi:transcription elongation factor Elf1
MEILLMTEKTNPKIEEKNTPREIVFKCKFCGDVKAIAEMTIMRQYYPQLAACKVCALSKNNLTKEEPCKS